MAVTGAALKGQWKCLACNDAGLAVDPWVRALEGKSGVYLIRSKRTGALLYIGESHTNNLRGTLLRHFQHWAGRTAGKRYNRHTVKIRVLVLSRVQAVKVQNRLIRQMQPRDNTFQKGVPF